MWLFNVALSYFGWCKSVNLKFWRIVPWTTLSIVVMALVSQVSLFLAFILPLKVVMLMGADGVPSYFPAILANFEKPVLIVTLCACSVVFYLLNLLMEKMIDVYSMRGASVVALKTRNLELFGDPGELAGEVYYRVARSLSAMIFLVLVFASLYVVYSLVFYSIVVFLFLAFSLVSIFASFSLSIRSWTECNKKVLLDVLSSVGFLVVFVVIVSDYLLGGGVGVMFSIIAIIITRQLYKRVTVFITDGFYLTSKKVQIKSLFYNAGHFSRPSTDSEGRLIVSDTESVALGSDDAWLTGVVAGYLGDESVSLVSRTPFDTAFKNLFLIRVVVECSVGRRTFWLKLFAKRFWRHALSEADLLTAMPELPAFKLVLVTRVGACECHLYEGGGEGDVFPRELSDAALSDEKYQLLLNNIYRCNPVGALPQHQGDALTYGAVLLSPAMWGSLIEFSSASSRSQIVCLSESMSKVVDVLKRLPRVVLPRRIKAGSFLEFASGPVLIHWGAWDICPVGSGWRGNFSGSEISKILDLLSASRADLKGVDATEFELAAHVFSFYNQVARMQYEAAIPFVEKILSCMEKITSIDERG